MVKNFNASKVCAFNMNTWHVPGRYDFSIPAAQKLSDLSDIKIDLEAVIRICARCEKLTKGITFPKKEGGLEWFDEIQALGDLAFAAVVRYGRTFNTGTRSGIPATWIASLSSDLQKEHVYYKNLRDKYIAHSVNQLEDNQVFVMLSPQFSEDQRPTSITVDEGRLINLGLSAISQLAALSSALLNLTLNEIKLENAQLLMIAQTMPLDEIKARGSKSVPIPNKAQTFRIRQKFK